MSYCRWSSDNFQSDLYVYEDVYGGWTIHVAGNRIVGDVPPIVWPLDPKNGAQFGEYVASRSAQSAFLETANRETIKLPGAGETFVTDSPGACADKIEELASIGFIVPAGVVEELRAEDAESVDREGHCTERPVIERDKSRDEPIPPPPPTDGEVK